ncbi:MAG: hypothetical protein INF34_01265 [Roseomonas sp.]|nr:hypothetical protein [Roseomonas sp.]MCA3425306.1 hypothetical protein [Roseomonas sp.]
MTSLNQTVDTLLRRALAKTEPLSRQELEGILHLMGKWRHQMISNTIMARDGLVVQGGPFAAMQLPPYSAEGCRAPKLLGCYEEVLHPHLEKFIARGFDAVLNIGCAEGYYAIGLARRMQNTKIFAHDLNEGAQETCRAMAKLNGVADRITIDGLFSGGDFERFAALDTLVMVDIEGAEEALLDPEAFHALRQMTIVVECHGGPKRGTTETLTSRFQPTHHVTRLDQTYSQPTLSPWMRDLGHMDQLLAIWEWRGEPTPWLVMEPL